VVSVTLRKPPERNCTPGHQSTLSRQRFIPVHDSPRALYVAVAPSQSRHCKPNARGSVGQGQVLCPRPTALSLVGVPRPPRIRLSSSRHFLRLWEAQIIRALRHNHRPRHEPQVRYPPLTARRNVYGDVGSSLYCLLFCLTQ
jgi:hypothetical protein